MIIAIITFSIADCKPKLWDSLKILFPHASHWKNIGVFLEMDTNELDKIENDEKGVENCLRVMLSKWLKQVDPVPTWKGLAEAVEVIDQTLAEKIQKYPSN